MNTLFHFRLKAYLFALAMIVLIGFSTLCECATANDQPVIHVGSEVNFPPYAFVDEQGQAAGFSVDLIKAVANTMGLSIDISTGTWDREWNALVSGQLDLLPIVAKNPSRLTLVDFSLPHTETSDAFFVRQGDPPIPDLASSKSKSIVTMRSDASHHELLERDFQGNLVLVDSIPEGLRLVESGKHDAFLGPLLICSLEIKDKNIRGLEAGTPIPDYKRVFSFGVRKGADNLRETLNQGLLIIKTNGEYDRIYEKWLAIDDPIQKNRIYLLAAVPVALGIVGLAFVVMGIRKRVLLRRNAELTEHNERLERAEKLLRKSELRLLEAQRLAKAGSWGFDLQTGAIWGSDEVFHIYGMEPSSSNLLPIDEIEACIPEKERVHQALVDLINEDKPYDLEFDVLPANGSVRKRIISRAKLERDNKGNLIQVTGVIQDISKQRDLLEQEKQAREKYQQLYGAIRDAILIADTDRQIIELNSAFSDLFGYTLDDLKGKQTSVIYENESEFRRLGELIRQDANKDESRVYTIHYRKKSGEVFSGETAVFMVYNAEGDVSGFMGLIRDITEKESLERQLAYAQKLESIGLLAAGVAHEINTPIMYVSGNMDFLKGAFEGMSQLIEKQKELHIAVGKNQDTTFLLSDIEKTREAVKLDVLLEEIPQTIADIKEGLDRVSLIVQAMKKFSHPGMGTIKPTDVNEAVENIITITSNEWKHTSKLVRDFAKGLPLIECVPGDFNQVILNLLVNAAHANSYMVKENGRGTITVSTALTGEFVEICISDTGTGIPVKNESKIFDPFFTTKEVGKGTGQGLSMVYTIMKNHGGTITFSSEKNTGTSFSLRFPIKQAGQNQSS